MARRPPGTGGHPKAWDAAERLANANNHGLSADASSVLRNLVFEEYTGAQRYIGGSRLKAGEIEFLEAKAKRLVRENPLSEKATT